MRRDDALAMCCTVRAATRVGGMVGQRRARGHMYVPKVAMPSEETRKSRLVAWRERARTHSVVLIRRDERRERFDVAPTRWQEAFGLTGEASELGARDGVDRIQAAHDARISICLS